MREYFGLDIYDSLTISSLGDKYFHKKDVYDGCYEIGGRVRMFIQKCVVGGRVMTNKNEIQIKINPNVTLGGSNIEEQHVENDDDMMNDFDGVSLYPSAMLRTLLPKGVPKLFDEQVTLNSNNIDEFLKSYDGLFVKCKVLKVGKLLDFPLQSK